MEENHGKHDHMAMIAIVAIVAIVALFLLFFKSSTTASESTEDLSGQAYLPEINPKSPVIEILEGGPKSEKSSGEAVQVVSYKQQGGSYWCLCGNMVVECSGGSGECSACCGAFSQT